MYAVGCMATCFHAVCCMAIDVCMMYAVWSHVYMLYGVWPVMHVEFEREEGWEEGWGLLLCRHRGEIVMCEG